MKKIMTVLIMIACTAAYAQNGLEQFQQQGSDAMPTRNTTYDINNSQEHCVSPKYGYDYNDGLGGEGQYNNWNNDVQDNGCTNDPETCNCLNHEKEGHVSPKPVDAGKQGVPVIIYNIGGEKALIEAGLEQHLYWYNGDTYQTDSDATDIWLPQNTNNGDPEAGSPLYQKDSDGLQRKGGGPNRG